MAQQDAVEQLKDRFAKPLEEFEQRRVVFWHYIDGSFEDQFDALTKGGIPSERAVRFLKLSGSNRFVAKRELYRLHAGDDFLVYTTEPKDFSPKALEKNWLADIEIYSEHFQADFASLLAESLGAKDAAIEGVSMFRQFFNAADRRARFVKLMPQAETKADVALGVIGATFGSERFVARDHRQNVSRFALRGVRSFGPAFEIRGGFAIRVARFEKNRLQRRSALAR